MTDDELELELAYRYVYDENYCQPNIDNCFYPNEMEEAQRIARNEIQQIKQVQEERNQPHDEVMFYE